MTSDGRSKGRYDPQFLRAMVGDSIRVLAEIKKEDFVDEVRFEIESGECVQTLPEECASFLEFLCFLNCDTGEQYPVFSGNFQDIRKLNYVPSSATYCSGLDALSSFSAGFSPNSTRVFAINPSIPEGSNFKAIALCSVVNELVNDVDADLPEVVKPLIPALVSMTSYLLLLADTADPTAASQAQQHLATVTTILQITTARLLAAAQVSNDN